MKYLLTLWGDETRGANATPEEQQAEMARWDAYTTGVRDAGVFVAGEGLQPSATATTVRVDDSLVTDGPFAETKEQLGGFYLLDCKDLDEAIAWGKKIPMTGGSVEIRPVMQFD